jgi:hypothetical protein
VNLISPIAIIFNTFFFFFWRSLRFYIIELNSKSLVAMPNSKAQVKCEEEEIEEGMREKKEFMMTEQHHHDPKMKLYNIHKKSNFFLLSNSNSLKAQRGTTIVYKKYRREPLIE